MKELNRLRWEKEESDRVNYSTIHPYFANMQGDFFLGG